MTTKRNLTTVNIGSAEKELLSKLSAAHGMSQTKFVNEMVFYFKTTGLNPLSTERFSPKVAIENLAKKMNQSIGFFQKHEKEKLQPLLDQLIIANQKLSRNLEYSVTKNDLNGIDLEFKKISTSFSEIEKQQRIIYNSLNELEKTEEVKFEKLRATLNKAHSIYISEEQKTQKMLKVLFESITTKGLTGVKQELIDKFNSI